MWLTVLGLLNSAVGAYYYLRILVTMYLREPGEAASAVPPLTPTLRLALILPAAGTLFLGMFPAWPGVRRAVCRDGEVDSRLCGLAVIGGALSLNTD